MLMTVGPERDLGTPAVESVEEVTVSIDGMPVSVPSGTTVMRAAAIAGVDVPKLCATEDLEPFGSCRLCLVEIEGRKGYFAPTPYVESDERTTSRYPLLLTTGRILSQYNVGAQTRRTRNVEQHAEDELEMHPSDAEMRGIKSDDWVGIKSRAGETVLRVVVTERVQPGVLYTTFHHPESGANVVTTDNSDWATNCPEYKVTAVQAYPVSQPSEWQEMFRAFSSEQEELLSRAQQEDLAEA